MIFTLYTIISNRTDGNDRGYEGLSPVTVLARYIIRSSEGRVRCINKHRRESPGCSDRPVVIRRTCLLWKRMNVGRV